MYICIYIYIYGSFSFVSWLGFLNRHPTSKNSFGTILKDICHIHIHTMMALSLLFHCGGFEQTPYTQKLFWNYTQRHMSHRYTYGIFSFVSLWGFEQTPYTQKLFSNYLQRHMSHRYTYGIFSFVSLLGVLNRYPTHKSSFGTTFQDICHIRIHMAFSLLFHCGGFEQTPYTQKLFWNYPQRHMSHTYTWVCMCIKVLVVACDFKRFQQ